MANVHVQTAATNLRRAVNDARVRQKQLQDEINRMQREADERIKQMKQEQLMIQHASNDNNQDAAARMQKGFRYDNLDIEEKQIQQDVAAKRREMENEINTIEDQAQQLDSVARQLDFMV